MAKPFRNLILTVALALLAAVPVYAQTTVDSTTLAAAVTATANQVSVTSATNVAVGNILFVDREAMRVSALSGTVATVTRGFNGTAARAHAALATLYTGPPVEFYASEVVVGSTCTATAEQYTPRIVLPTGNVYKCSNSTWEQIGAEVNAIYVTCRALLVADQIDQSCFTADRDFVVAGITEVHTTAESAGTLTLIVRRQEGTEASASGDALITALDMVGAGAVAQTVKTATLTATSSLLILDAGDRIGLDFTDDVAGELAGVVVTVKLIPR